MGREWGEDDPASPGTSQQGPWARRSPRLPVCLAPSACSLGREAADRPEPFGQEVRRLGSPLTACGAHPAPHPHAGAPDHSGAWHGREPHRRCKAEEAVAAAF